MIDHEGKLIRDRIPAVLRAQGENPKLGVPRDAKHAMAYLRKKLLEEVSNWVQTGDFEQMAEVMTVWDEIQTRMTAKQYVEVMAMQAEKDNLRGTYKNLVVWYGNELPPMAPQQHKQGSFPDENLGGHIFRYAHHDHMQRRCVACGLWEVDESRKVTCTPSAWVGAPWGS